MAVKTLFWLQMYQNMTLADHFGLVKDMVVNERLSIHQPQVANDIYNIVHEE